MILWFRRCLVLPAATLALGCHRAATSDLAPSQTARAFFDALAHSQWDSAAALADSEWLVSYHARQVVFIQSIALGRKTLGPEGVTMPGDTFTARFLRAFGSRSVPGFPGVGTFADLLRISPRKFLTSCFEGMTAGPGRVAPGERWTVHVVGQVLENSDRAYVVYRHTGRTANDQPWTLPLIRTGRRWGYTLPNFFAIPDCALVANVAGYAKR